MKERLPFLDETQVLNIDNSTHEFPLHYHDIFCISVIGNGMFGENELIASVGTLLISHPNELHQNNLVNDTTYKMSTFYMNEDIMKFGYEFEHIYFKDKEYE